MSCSRPKPLQDWGGGECWLLWSNSTDSLSLRCSTSIVIFGLFYFFPSVIQFYHYFECRIRIWCGDKSLIMQYLSLCNPCITLKLALCFMTHLCIGYSCTSCTSNLHCMFSSLSFIYIFPQYNPLQRTSFPFDRCKRGIICLKNRKRNNVQKGSNSWGSLKNVSVDVLLIFRRDGLVFWILRIKSKTEILTFQNLWLMSMVGNCAGFSAFTAFIKNHCMWWGVLYLIFVICEFGCVNSILRLNRMPKLPAFNFVL